MNNDQLNPPAAAKVGAPLGNTNNLKAIKASSFVQLRCLRQDKAAWVKQGEKKGGLSAWIIATLNAALQPK